MPIGTFSYGGKYPKWVIKMLYFVATLVLITLLITILSFLGSSNSEEMADYVTIGSILALAATPMVVLAYLMNRHNEHLEQQMQLWLQDAVQTEGYMICTSHGKPSIFEITIKYNGEEIIFVTSTKFSKEFPFANTRGFWVMCDATIPVLYSPKYNQVMFVDTSRCEEIL